MPPRELLEKTLLVATAIGLAAIPFGALFGINSPVEGGRVSDEVMLRRRSFADATMISGGGVALVAAIGLGVLRTLRPR